MERAEIKRKWQISVLPTLTFLSMAITGLSFLGMCLQIPPLHEKIATECFYIFSVLSFLFSALATVSFVFIHTGCLADDNQEVGSRKAPTSMASSLTCLSVISFAELMMSLCCFSSAAMIAFYTYFSLNFTSGHALIALFVSIGVCGLACLFSLCWVCYFQLCAPCLLRSSENYLESSTPPPPASV